VIALTVTLVLVLKKDDNPDDPQPDIEYFDPYIVIDYNETENYYKLQRDPKLAF
jgi:hypothetical protein